MREISVHELMMNPMDKIAEQWMLITAGDERGCNTMTASWGHLGSIWHQNGRTLPTSVVYLRPQRYTKEFVDREALYTLCFFPDHKKELTYLGSHSGRDGDKVGAVGLTPVFGDGYTYFAEAELVLVCRKLYRAPLLEEGFLDEDIIEKNYPNRDFHDLYIGEIVKVLEKEQ